MTTAMFRFYEELNDFLPPGRRKVSFATEVAPGDTVARCLSRLAVPTEAVDLVLVDGEPAALDNPVPPGARVAVYPVFESFDVASLVKDMGRPLRRLRFSLPPDLEELAERLVAAGIDAVVLAGEEGECAVLAEDQGRTWLTLDAELALGSGLRRVYRVRASKPRQQLAEVLARFQLPAREIPRPP